MSDVTLAAAVERARGAAAVTDPEDAAQVRLLGRYCGELVAMMAQAGIGTIDALRDEMWDACIAEWQRRPRPVVQPVWRASAHRE